MNFKIMDREIRFKVYLSNKGNNHNRKRFNFFKSIKSIKFVYNDSSRGMVLRNKYNRLNFKEVASVLNGLNYFK